MAGYALRSYAVPGVSASLVTSNSDAVYGDWVALGAAVPLLTGTWFCLPVLDTTSMAHSCPNGGWWDHRIGLQFGDADSISRLSVLLGTLYGHATASYGAELAFPGALTWGGAPLTKVRAYAAGTPFWGPQAATVTLSFAGGSLRVYQYSTTLPPLDVSAVKTAQEHAVTDLTLTAPATRMRYRVKQLSAGDMSWSGTPVGTDLRRYT